jgi:3-keto-5-aminohexanoate cleavage enzyme
MWGGIHMEKIVVTAALTGGLHKKASNPNLPEKPEEIVQAAYECYNEGAAIIHLHARDPEGNASGDPKIYQEIHEKIRAKCDVILQDTTGGGPNMTLEQRLASLDANPEMASLNMGTMVRSAEAYKGTLAYNPPWEIERFAKAMLEKDIKPEMEVYSPSMFRDVRNLVQKGLLNKPYYINLVIGVSNQGGLDPTTESLLMMLSTLPKLNDIIINVTVIGRAQLRITTLGMLLGTNVRVGMEDNIYYSKGVLAQRNAQFVARTVKIAQELGFEIATPVEARQVLKVTKKAYHPVAP